MPTLLKGKIVWDEKDWLGSFDQTSATTVNKKGVGIANAQRVDPMRTFGYIAPGFDPVDATNQSSVTGTILNGVVNGTSAYCVTADGKLQKLDTLSGTVSVDTTGIWPYSIAHGAHTSFVGSDIVNYYKGTTLAAFYSYYDNTDWNVGYYPYTGSPDDDFMSTVPASPLASPYLEGGQGKPHPLVVGDDDILYMGDRNFVHAYDGQNGTDGTFSAAVFTLPVGWTITAFAKTNDFKLAIAAYFTSSVTGSTFNLGQAKVFVWDYLSLDPTYIYNLNDNYVAELVNWRGTLLAFTAGRQSIAEPNNFKLQSLAGVQFSVLVSYQTGSAPCRGGVDIINDDIIWNAAGKVYTYSRIPQTQKYILNSPFGTPSNTSGMCKIFSSTLNVIFSSGTGSLVGLVFAKTGTFADSAVLDLKTAYPFTNQRVKGRIQSVTIKYLSATSTNTGRQFSLVSIRNKTASATVLDLTPTNAIEEIYYNNSDASTLGDFTSLGFELQWNGGSDNTKCPIIDSIIVDYTEVAI